MTAITSLLLTACDRKDLPKSYGGQNLGALEVLPVSDRYIYNTTYIGTYQEVM